jgi:hypothetical protein
MLVEVDLVYVVMVVLEVVVMVVDPQLLIMDQLDLQTLEVVEVDTDMPLVVMEVLVVMVVQE